LGGVRGAKGFVGGIDWEEDGGHGAVDDWSVLTQNGISDIRVVYHIRAGGAHEMRSAMMPNIVVVGGRGR